MSAILRWAAAIAPIGGRSIAYAAVTPEARYLPPIMTYECGGLNALSLESQAAAFL